MADPFAAAGFAPQQAQQQVTNDPFGGAGFVAAPVEKPALVKQEPLGIGSVDEYGAPITPEAQKAEGRVAEKMLEGATFGLAPYAEAIPGWLGGKPYSQALQEARDFTNQTSQEHPVIGGLAEAAGGLGPTIGAMGAARPLVRAVSRLPYVGAPLAQSLLGAALGGASTAGHDIGSGNTADLGSDVAHSAGVGGAIGAVAPAVGAALQMAPNAIRSVGTAVRNVFTPTGRDAVAGQVLREAGGNFANTNAASPLPGLALRTAQSTGNPGLAGLERTLASEPGMAAPTAENVVKEGRTPAQTSALADALVGSDARMEPTALTNQASAGGVQAIQNARDVLRQAETDLWNAPELTGVRLHQAPFVNGVVNDVAGMPPSFRMSLERGPLAPLMADVHALPEGASIPDVNAIRSRVLAVGRAAGASGDPTTAAAANALGDSLLNRVEASLGGAGPQIQEAYAAARDLTRQRAQAFGYPDFDAILRPNAAGNMRANPENAFGRFFDLSGGTNAGLQRLQGVSDLLRRTGQPEAIAAADQLDQQAQNYLRAGILGKARAGNGLDATGQPAMNVATLASTVNKAMPAVSGTPMTAPIAGDIQAAGNAAELLGRPAALRGDTNSTTFEKLRNKDLVSAILGQTGSSSLGAVGGGYAAGRYGPEEVPWYLRVPAGALAGAILGQRAGPYIGRVAAHIPGASMAITGPTQDIMRRVAAGLASPAEYQRLIATSIPQGPGLMQPGMLSAGVPTAAQLAIPDMTRRGP